MLHSLQNQKYITFCFFLSEISVYLQMCYVLVHRALRMQAWVFSNLPARRSELQRCEGSGCSTLSATDARAGGQSP